MTSYKTFLEKAGLKECVIIQTCNRVEVFAASKHLDEQKLLEEWGSTVGLSNKEFTNIVEIDKDKDVVYASVKTSIRIRFISRWRRSGYSDR